MGRCVGEGHTNPSNDPIFNSKHFVLPNVKISSGLEDMDYPTSPGGGTGEGALTHPSVMQNSILGNFSCLLHVKIPNGLEYMTYPTFNFSFLSHEIPTWNKVNIFTHNDMKPPYYIFCIIYMDMEEEKKIQSSHLERSGSY